MKDEIKEILDDMKIVAEHKTVGVMGQQLNFKNARILLDYITNLQEENEEWSMIFDTFSKRPYAHKYLGQKKKELGNDKIIGLDSEMIYKDYYDYKSRNEKAIEYIKEKISSTQGVINDYMYHKEHNKILIELLQEDIEMYKKELNILNGGDEE